MKTQIRQGVFETNSSSVHSISIIKNDFKGSLPKKFTIDNDGKFGWETCVYDGALRKAAYLYQAIVSYPTYNGRTKEKHDAKIAKEKLTELFDLFPILHNELAVENYGKDYIRLVFRNGSIFDVVGANPLPSLIAI